MKHSKEVIDQVIELSETLSSRAICRELGWPESKKSTVNDIISRYSDSVEEVEETDGDNIPEDMLNVLCENPDYNVSNLAKRLRNAQRTNNQLRKVQREVFDQEDPETLSDKIVNKIKQTIQINPASTYTPKCLKNATVEILFSDLQIGKVSQYYNSDVAKKALGYYGRELVTALCLVQPERIVFASLGDIVEDHMKHGVQSAISTDTGLAEQMADAIEYVYKLVLAPILKLGIPTEIICVSGNHGSSQHKGMDNYKAGRYGYDYTIARGWQALCEVQGFSNVEFNIPEGCFATTNIYGQNYLYEHGYTNGVGSEKQMFDHKNKRGENLKTYLHGYRCGDKHHSVTYDNSYLVCNGSFFGVENQGAEYSGIMGFNSIPTQGVIIHEPTTGVGQSTISDTIWIQIAKGY